MREMSQEQAAFLAHLNSDEVRKANEALEVARAEARAESDKRWAIYTAQCELDRKRRAETVRPLKEAMQAAGIKLSLSSYEGVWGSYQIGNGPEVDLDLDGFDTFPDEEEDEC